MAVLPKYERKAQLPALELPNIPTSLGTSVSEAVAKVGAQVFSEGVKWIDMMQKAEDTKQAYEAVSAASVALQDLQNKTLQDPIFNTDPEAARLQWDQQARELGEQIAQGIPSQRAGQYFKERYLGYVASHGKEMSDAIRRQRVDIIKGSGLAAIQGHAGAIAGASSEELIHSNVRDAFATIDGMIASGAANYADRETMRRGFLDHAFKTRLMNTALRDPLAAQNDLQWAQARGYLTPEASLDIATKIKPLVEARTARGIADGVLSSAGAPRQAGKLSAEQIAVGREVYDTFIKDGYEPHQAAGAVSVLFNESGLNPMEKRGDNGTAWYLAQWRESRQTGVREYAQSKSENEPSVATQAEYMIRELNSPEFAKAKDALRNAKTEREATDAFMIHFEKPKDQTPGRYALIGNQINPKVAPEVVRPRVYTAQELQTNYGQLEKDVEDRANAASNGDPRYRDMALSEFRTRTQLILRDQQLKDEASRNLLIQATVGPNGAKTMDQLLSDPNRAAAYSSLYQSDPASLQHLRNAIEHNARGQYSPDNAKAYYDLMDLAANNPRAFSERDLLQDYAALSKEDWHKLVLLQADLKSGKKDPQAETLHQAIQGELNTFYDQNLAPSATKHPESRAKWEVSKADAYKAIEDAIKAEKAANNGRPVAPDRAREIARGYLINGVLAGKGFWGIGVVTGRGFEYQSNKDFVPDQTQVPDRFKQAIATVEKESGGKRKAVAKFDSSTREWYLMIDGQRWKIREQK
ncbi:MAG: phage tail-type lysozyme domain-containing protein [Desulfobacteraceae bacterium]|nr:phage tail-type lysozyme domain-containing protein [Desulfobacteraceae bacterium]